MSQSEESIVEAALKKICSVYGDICSGISASELRNVDELKDLLGSIRTGVAALIGSDVIVVESNDARDLRSKLVTISAVFLVILTI
jgi:hypothetical protein